MVQPNKRRWLFSDRYKDILSDSDFKSEFDFHFCAALEKTLSTFNEPIREYTDRYSSYEENTNVYKRVYSEFFRRRGWDEDRIDDIDLEWLVKLKYYDWLDIIELWESELSSGERYDFGKEINDVFKAFSQPWRLVQGDVVKIDGKQFGQDLIRESLEYMSVNICGTPIFQGALDEYKRALEYFQQDNFKDCVLYAQKSYESVLKIACNLREGQADGLTKAFMESRYIDDLPSQVNRNGFRMNVLMCMPYLRNQLKVGHGEGGETIVISEALAQLALNLTASLNSFLVDQYKTNVLVESVESSQRVAVGDDDTDLPF